MRALPVERLYLKSGEVLELAYPKSINYLDGRVISGVQRNPDGTEATRIVPFDTIERRVAIGLSETGEVVEDYTYSLPSEW